MSSDLLPRRSSDRADQQMRLLAEAPRVEVYDQAERRRLQILEEGILHRRQLAPATGRAMTCQKESAQTGDHGCSGGTSPLRNR